MVVTVSCVKCSDPPRLFPPGSKVARRLDVLCPLVLPDAPSLLLYTHTQTLSLTLSRLDFPTSPSHHAKQTMGCTMEGRARVPACPRAAGGTQVSHGSQTAVCVCPPPSLPTVMSQLTGWRCVWVESPLIRELPAWRDLLTWRVVDVCLFFYEDILTH